MLTVKTKSDLRQALHGARLAGHSIGLVPTMGNLHDGHLQLVRAAVADCQYTVASIFINPLQFETSEDLNTYPRSLEYDTSLLSETGCDLLFAPDITEMYGIAGSMKTNILVSGVTQNHCGKTRPGHFEGVATVVTKLFNLISPDQAYFGLKDYQQFRVIEQLIADLEFAVKLNGLPTVREDSGLALSSRNSRLTSEQRRLAPALYQRLQQTAELIRRGNQDLRRLESEARQSLAAHGLQPDYYNICHARSLEMACQHDKDLVILAAVFAGDIRLIDNVSLTI